MVQYTTNGGTNWLDARNYAPAGADPATLPWTAQSLTVPSNTNGVRFGLYADSSADDALYVDGVSVSALSAGLNTAGGSCQDNPNGTDCHSVTDVSVLHAGTATSCTACHKNATTAPLLDCQASGCHVGINLDEHVATGVGTPAHHESGMSTTGLFGTGFAGSWCSGCHDDSIANEHFALTAYASTPCRICHEKTVNSGPPTNVTFVNTASTIAKAPNTAACTDCHLTVTKSAPHVQRAGNGGTPGVQFADTWSGHKFYDTMPGSLTTFSGSTLTLPPVASILTNWSALTESTTMPVRCNDCHGSVTGAAGPHGATMSVNIASGYTTNYSTGGVYLTPRAPTSRARAAARRCAPSATRRRTSGA